MYPLVTLSALEQLLNGQYHIIERLERIERMNEELQAKLDASLVSQAATTAALENLAGDITAQGAKIEELTAALESETISAETQAKLDAVVAGDAALQAKAEALAAINP